LTEIQSDIAQTKNQIDQVAQTSEMQQDVKEVVDNVQHQIAKSWAHCQIT